MVEIFFFVKANFFAAQNTQKGDIQVITVLNEIIIKFISISLLLFTATFSYEKHVA